MGLIIRPDSDGKFITQEEWEKDNVEVSFVSKKTELAEIVKGLEEQDKAVITNLVNLFKCFLEEKPSDPDGTAMEADWDDEDDWGDE